MPALELLLSRGADLEAINNFAESPLHAALFGRMQSLVRGTDNFPSIERVFALGANIHSLPVSHGAVRPDEWRAKLGGEDDARRYKRERLTEPAKVVCSTFALHNYRDLGFARKSAAQTVVAGMHGHRYYDQRYIDFRLLLWLVRSGADVDEPLLVPEPEVSALSLRTLREFLTTTQRIDPREFEAALKAANDTRAKLLVTLTQQAPGVQAAAEQAASEQPLDQSRELASLAALLSSRNLMSLVVGYLF